MKVKAQVLRQGKWKHNAGVYACTPAKVMHHAKRFEEVTRLGYVLPYSIEHDQFELMTQAEYEKNKDKFLGKAAAVQLAKDGKGLDIELDVPNEKDAKYLKGMRFVSPGIREDIQLGGKTLYGETICHVAATALPCQEQNAIAALSMVRLSYGEDDMADEPKKKKKEGEDEDEGEGMKDGARFKKLLQVLAEVGLIVPDDTTEENICDRLETAAMTFIGKKGEGEGEAEPIPESTSPVVMSLTKRLLDGEKKQLIARADGLLKSGRIDRPTHKKLQDQLRTVTLSLAPKGTGELNPTPVGMKIEAYEELPAGIVFGPGENDGQTLLAASQPPEFSRRPETAEEAKALDDDWDLAVGAGKK